MLREIKQPKVGYECRTLVSFCHSIALVLEHLHFGSRHVIPHSKSGNMERNLGGLGPAANIEQLIRIPVYIFRISPESRSGILNLGVSAPYRRGLYTRLLALSSTVPHQHQKQTNGIFSCVGALELSLESVRLGLIGIPFWALHSFVLISAFVYLSFFIFQFVVPRRLRCGASPSTPLKRNPPCSSVHTHRIRDHRDETAFLVIGKILTSLSQMSACLRLSIISA
jgi:hypothetical protein